MPTYHYQFDLTSSTTSIGASDTVPDEGYDLSEFNGDSRGTARVADWTDLDSMSESEYDIFLEVLGLSSNSTCFVSSVDNPVTENGYYWNDGIRNRPYWTRISPSSSGGWHDTHIITGTLYNSSSKNLVLGSWPATLKALVFFPNYKANGGHETLTINIA
jgi:hypothetical protein